MTVYNVEIVVNGKDNASGPFRSAGNALSNIGQIAAGILAAGIFQKLAQGLADFAINGIKNASSLNESINKTRVVFGDSADSMLKWSESSATALGLSQQKALDAAAGFAVFGKAAGLAGQDVIDFSQQGLARAADMASIFNTTVEDAALAMQAAFRGETEPIRKYGVMLDDATMRAKALELGIISNTKNALTPQQKVLAANALIMEQTSFTAGDFANTSDQLANSQRILDAQLENAGAQLGTTFLPMITTVMGFVNTQAIPIIQDLIKKFDALAGPALSGLSKGLTSIDLGSLVEKISNFAKTSQDLAASIVAKLQPGIENFGRFWTEQGPEIQRIAGEMLAKFAGVAKWFADQIIPFLVFQFNKLGSWFAQNGPLISKFGAVVSTVFGAILSVGQALFSAALPLLNGFMNLFLQTATFLMQLFTGDFTAAGQTVQLMFWTTFYAIQQSFTNLAAWVTGWFGTDWATVMAQWGAFFTGMWTQAVSEWNTGTANIVATAQGWWAQMGKESTTGTAKIRANWDTFWNTLKLNTINFTLSIVSTITTWIANMLTAVTTFVTNLVASWTDGWNQLVNGVLSAGDNILTAVSDMLGDVIAGLGDAVAKFADIGASIVQSIITGIEGAWTGFVTWLATKVAEAIKNLINSLLPKSTEGTPANGEGAPIPTSFGGNRLVPALAMAGNGGGNIRKNAYYFGGVTVYQTVKPQSGRNLLKDFD